MVDSETLARARQLSASAHGGQVDKAGRPYIEHPTRVAARVAAVPGVDARAVIVAWLHDVVEDSPISLEAVAAEFGDRIASAVDALSRREAESAQDYYARVLSDELAVVVKLADIDDNTDPSRLAQLPAELAERLRKKYEQARQVLRVQS